MDFIYIQQPAAGQKVGQPGPDTAPGGLGKQNFSVVWEGTVKVPKTGDYTFYVKSDDGARLYVNNSILIDEYHDQPLREHQNGGGVDPYSRVAEHAGDHGRAGH